MGDVYIRPGVQRPEASDASEVGVTGHCELPDVSTRKQTQVLSKTSMLSDQLDHCFHLPCGVLWNHPSPNHGKCSHTVLSVLVGGCGQNWLCDRRLGSREWDQNQNWAITFKVVSYFSSQAPPNKGSTDSENNPGEQEPKHDPVKEISVSNYNKSMWATCGIQSMAFSKNF